MKMMFTIDAHILNKIKTNTDLGQLCFPIVAGIGSRDILGKTLIATLSRQQTSESLSILTKLPRFPFTVGRGMRMR